MTCKHVTFQSPHLARSQFGHDACPELFPTRQESGYLPIGYKLPKIRELNWPASLENDEGPITTSTFLPDVGMRTLNSDEGLSPQAFDYLLAAAG